MNLLRKILRRTIALPYRIYATRKLHRSTEGTIRGVTLQTDPDVFHPTCFLSTPLFADYLLTQPLLGASLLDMGTGSGAIGILAALAGADVVACDINPKAIALAEQNAAATGAKIALYLSDLFEAIPPTEFDWICFNIPFYPKVVTTPMEQALNAGEKFEVVRRFAEGAEEYVATGGRVAIIFSEDSGYDQIISIFLDSGYRIVDDRRRLKNLELFHITVFATE
ncbi:MAG: methyltransferase [Ignavibacteriae bacterium]|nr:methyltransferase [Ignavibacteriota bacterium]